MATKCCQCVSTGRCLRCSCVRAGKLCVGCYPSLKGLCENIPSSRPSSSDGGSSQTTVPSADLVVVPSQCSPHGGSQADRNCELMLPTVDIPSYKPVVPLGSVVWGDLEASSLSDCCSLIMKKWYIGECT